MRSVASGVVREASIQELIADFDKRKTRLLLILSTWLAANGGHCMTLR
jgi:hypothetical protein